MKTLGPRIMMRFDDGYEGIYTGWYPLCESLGLKGVVAVLSELDLGYPMTYDQAREMQADGWDFCLHGYSYDDDYRALSESEIETIILTAKTKLDDEDIDSDFFMAHGPNATRYGEEERIPEFATILPKYFLSSMNHFVADANDENIIDLYSQLCAIMINTDIPNIAYNITNEAGLLALKNILNMYSGQNRIIVLAGHDYNEELFEDCFTELINFANELGYRFITMSELYNELNINKDGLNISFSRLNSLIDDGADIDNITNSIQGQDLLDVINGNVESLNTNGVSVDFGNLSIGMKGSQLRNIANWVEEYRIANE